MADRTPQKWVNIVLSTYSGVPKAQKLKRTFHSSHPFSFHPPHFIFIPIQHWIVIQLAQQGVRSMWGTTFKPRNSILPTTFCNPPPPWIPNEAGPVKEHFLLYFYIMCAVESISMPYSFFRLGHGPKTGLWDSPQVWHAIPGPVGFSTEGSLE